MQPHRYIFTIILTFSFGTAFAHQDFWTSVDYGNVKIGHFNIKSLKLAFFASFNDLNVINKLVSLNC